ncbi:DUF6049 family protein [Nocardia sp. NBC_01388]|uniref:DUF6049 family protein n=1 Tax=Nocardia sp. NBC_01388 TaxID=2903596 RepID=UPI00324FB4CA
MTRAGSGRPGQDTAALHRWILSFVAVVVAVLTVCPSAATAQPSGSGSGAAPTGPKFLKLSLDSVTPTAITASSDPYFVVSGTITNIGDRPVDDVSVRIQRAAAVTNPSGLRSTLRLDQNSFDVTGEFQDVADRLDTGQRKQFSLTVALRSAPELPSGISSIDITAPGIYPLLLNVNGAPSYGGQARLDDARFLLPVLGVPIATPDPMKRTVTPTVPAVPDAPPVATTMLWPLADRPRLVAGATGSVQGSAMLTDDDLASSLASGGRLDQLLSALETALKPDGGHDRKLTSALCLAVDPDLLLTVSDMTDGYRVLASPSDPDGTTRAGTGAHAAKAWLDRLRTLAPTMCVVALPFAQVDPTALAAAGDETLSDRALNAPADLVDSLLSVKSVRGVALPDSGTLDTDGAGLLAHHGYTTAVLADNAVAPSDGRSNISSAKSPGGASESVNPDMVLLSGVTLPTVGGDAAGGPEMHAATFDIWSATALAAIGSHPPTPPFTPDRIRYDVTNDSRAARLQDALGAVAWTALNPEAGRPRSAVLMPPQQWGANRDEATAVLGQLDLLFRNNLAAPRSFTELLAQQPDPQPYDLDYLPAAADEAVPDHFAEPVRQQAHNITELMGALVDQPQQELTPRTFLTPLRDDLIRVLTMSDRRAGAAAADTTAQRRLDQTTRTIDDLFHSVTVLPPGGVYTLASEQSPLLLVARNDLPVAIRIKFRIDAPTETNIKDIGEQQLPAKGTRSFQIPTEVSDSRNLVIPIALTTPDGTPLGNAVSVSVRSNAYGRVLAIITASAGALLLLLAGRRLWHRFRGQSDPADEGFDPEKRRRVNKYLRARKRKLRDENQEAR